MLTSNAVLAHYDTKKQLCDASQYRLGAGLSHVLNSEEHPVAFASQTLEKEALAVIFRVKKFRKYVAIYGQLFTMVTDHKPLLSIIDNRDYIHIICSLYYLCINL